MIQMRWGTVFHQGSEHLDPTRIDFLDQYELVMNLYRPLVEYDSQNRLTSAVALRYDWDDKSLIFHFSPDRVRTIDGYSVMAQDAEISLKRAILFKSTGHGDIRRFLCPGYNLKSIADPCPGIRLDGDSKLILTPVLPSMKSHLLKALESADYSIIPVSSLDLTDPRILKSNHTETPLVLITSSEMTPLVNDFLGAIRTTIYMRLKCLMPFNWSKLILIRLQRT